MPDYKTTDYRSSWVGIVVDAGWMKGWAGFRFGLMKVDISIIGLGSGET